MFVKNVQQWNCSGLYATLGYIGRAKHVLWHGVYQHDWASWHTAYLASVGSDMHTHVGTDVHISAELQISSLPEHLCSDAMRNVGAGSGALVDIRGSTEGAVLPLGLSDGGIW